MKLKGKAKRKFLARMARGRNKGRKSSGKKQHRKRRSTPVAKRKTRRHHTKSSKRRHKRRSHSVGKWIPDQQKLVSIGTAFAYGKVEAAASKDPGHALNKVPGIIAQIGRAGNLGTGVWLAGVITRHPVVKAVAAGLITVAAYQNGRGSGFTKDKQEFSMSGPGPGHRRNEMLVEQYIQQQRRRA
jgi:hypothetical protein